jgi:hypothetical protein
LGEPPKSAVKGCPKAVGSYAKLRGTLPFGCESHNIPTVRTLRAKGYELEDGQCLAVPIEVHHKTANAPPC